MPSGNFGGVRRVITVRLSLTDDLSGGLTAALDAAEKRLAAFRQNVEGVGSAATKATAGIGTGFAGTRAFTTSASSQLERISERAGAAAQGIGAATSAQREFTGAVQAANASMLEQERRLSSLTGKWRELAAAIREASAAQRGFAAGSGDLGSTPPAGPGGGFGGGGFGGGGFGGGGFVGTPVLGAPTPTPAEKVNDRKDFVSGVTQGVARAINLTRPPDGTAIGIYPSGHRFPGSPTTLDPIRQLPAPNLPLIQAFERVLRPLSRPTPDQYAPFQQAFTQSLDRRFPDQAPAPIPPQLPARVTIHAAGAQTPETFFEQEQYLRRRRFPPTASTTILPRGDDPIIPPAPAGRALAFRPESRLVAPPESRLAVRGELGLTAPRRRFLQQLPVYDEPITISRPPVAPIPRLSGVSQRPLLPARVTIHAAGAQTPETFYEQERYFQRRRLRSLLTAPTTILPSGPPILLPPTSGARADLSKIRPPAGFSRQSIYFGLSSGIRGDDPLARFLTGTSRRLDAEGRVDLTRRRTYEAPIRGESLQARLRLAGETTFEQRQGVLARESRTPERQAQIDRAVRQAARQRLLQRATAQYEAQQDPSIDLDRRLAQADRAYQLAVRQAEIRHIPLGEGRLPRLIDRIPGRIPNIAREFGRDFAAAEVIERFREDIQTPVDQIPGRERALELVQRSVLEDAQRRALERQLQRRAGTPERIEQRSTFTASERQQRRNQLEDLTGRGVDELYSRFQYVQDIVGAVENIRQAEAGSARELQAARDLERVIAAGDFAAGFVNATPGAAGQSAPRTALQDLENFIGSLAQFSPERIVADVFKETSEYYRNIAGELGRAFSSHIGRGTFSPDVIRPLARLRLERIGLRQADLESGVASDRAAQADALIAANIEEISRADLSQYPNLQQRFSRYLDRQLTANRPVGQLLERGKVVPFSEEALNIDREIQRPRLPFRQTFQSGGDLAAFLDKFPASTISLRVTPPRLDAFLPERPEELQRFSSERLRQIASGDAPESAELGRAAAQYLQEVQAGEARFREADERFAPLQRPKFDKNAEDFVEAVRTYTEQLEAYEAFLAQPSQIIQRSLERFQLTDLSAYEGLQGEEQSRLTAIRNENLINFARLLDQDLLRQSVSIVALNRRKTAPVRLRELSDEERLNIAEEELEKARDAFAKVEDPGIGAALAGAQEIARQAEQSGDQTRILEAQRALASIETASERIARAQARLDRAQARVRVESEYAATEQERAQGIERVTPGVRRVSRLQEEVASFRADPRLASETAEIQSLRQARTESQLGIVQAARESITQTGRLDSSILDPLINQYRTFFASQLFFGGGPVQLERTEPSEVEGVFKGRDFSRLFDNERIRKRLSDVSSSVLSRVNEETEALFSSLEDRIRTTPRGLGISGQEFADRFPITSALQESTRRLNIERASLGIRAEKTQAEADLERRQEDRLADAARSTARRDAVERGGVATGEIPSPVISNQVSRETRRSFDRLISEFDESVSALRRSSSISTGDETFDALARAARVSAGVALLGERYIDPLFQEFENEVGGQAVTSRIVPLETLQQAGFIEPSVAREQADTAFNRAAQYLSLQRIESAITELRDRRARQVGLTSAGDSAGGRLAELEAIPDDERTGRQRREIRRLRRFAGRQQQIVDTGIDANEEIIRKEIAKRIRAGEFTETGDIERILGSGVIPQRQTSDQDLARVLRDRSLRYEIIQRFGREISSLSTGSRITLPQRDIERELAGEAPGLIQPSVRQTAAGLLVSNITPGPPPQETAAAALEAQERRAIRSQGAPGVDFRINRGIAGGAGVVPLFDISVAERDSAEAIQRRANIGEIAARANRLEQANRELGASVAQRIQDAERNLDDARQRLSGASPDISRLADPATTRHPLEQERDTSLQGRARRLSSLVAPPIGLALGALAGGAELDPGFAALSAAATAAPLIAPRLIERARRLPRQILERGLEAGERLITEIQPSTGLPITRDRLGQPRPILPKGTSGFITSERDVQRIPFGNTFARASALGTQRAAFENARQSGRTFVRNLGTGRLIGFPSQFIPPEDPATFVTPREVLERSYSNIRAELEARLAQGRARLTSFGEQALTAGRTAIGAGQQFAGSAAAAAGGAVAAGGERAGQAAGQARDAIRRETVGRIYRLRGQFSTIPPSAETALAIPDFQQTVAGRNDFLKRFATAEGAAIRSGLRGRLTRDVGATFGASVDGRRFGTQARRAFSNEFVRSFNRARGTSGANFTSAANAAYDRAFVAAERAQRFGGAIPSARPPIRETFGAAFRNFGQAAAGFAAAPAAFGAAAFSRARPAAARVGRFFTGNNDTFGVYGRAYGLGVLAQTAGGGPVSGLIGGLVQAAAVGSNPYLFAYALAQIGQSIRGIASEANRLTAVDLAFGNITTNALGAGAGVEVLDRLRDRFGSISTDSQLQEFTNRILSIDAAASSDEVVDLAEIGLGLGKAFGRSPEESIQSFSLLLSNESIRRLDSFGISAIQVRERIAQLQGEFDTLTRSEAFYIATTEAAQTSLDKIGGVEGITTEQEAFGTGFSRGSEAVTGRLGGLFEHLARGVNNIFDPFGVIVRQESQALALSPIAQEEIATARERVRTTRLEELGREFSPFAPDFDVFESSQVFTEAARQQASLSDLNFPLPIGEEFIESLPQRARAPYQRAVDAIRESDGSLELNEYFAYASRALQLLANEGLTGGGLINNQRFFAQGLTATRDPIRVGSDPEFSALRQRLSENYQLDVQAADFFEGNIEALFINRLESSPDQFSEIVSDIQNIRAAVGASDSIRELGYVNQGILRALGAGEDSTATLQARLESIRQGLLLQVEDPSLDTGLPFEAGQFPPNIVENINALVTREGERFETLRKFYAGITGEERQQTFAETADVFGLLAVRSRDDRDVSGQAITAAGAFGIDYFADPELFLAQGIQDLPSQLARHVSLVRQFDGDREAVRLVDERLGLQGDLRQPFLDIDPSNDLSAAFDASLQYLRQFTEAGGDPLAAPLAEFLRTEQGRSRFEEARQERAGLVQEVIDTSDFALEGVGSLFALDFRTGLSEAPQIPAVFSTQRVFPDDRLREAAPYQNEFVRNLVNQNAEGATAIVGAIYDEFPDLRSEIAKLPTQLREADSARRRSEDPGADRFFAAIARQRVLSDFQTDLVGRTTTTLVSPARVGQVAFDPTDAGGLRVEQLVTSSDLFAQGEGLSALSISLERLSPQFGGEDSAAGLQFLDTAEAARAISDNFLQAASILQNYEVRSADFSSLFGLSDGGAALTTFGQRLENIGLGNQRIDEILESAGQIFGTETPLSAFATSPDSLLGEYTQFLLREDPSGRAAASLETQFSHLLNIRQTNTEGAATVADAERIVRFLAEERGDDAFGFPRRALAARTGFGSYTVQPGDTFSGIAQEYGLSVEDIQGFNPGIQPRAIPIGAQLNLGQQVPAFGGSPDAYVGAYLTPPPVDTELNVPNLDTSDLNELIASLSDVAGTITFDTNLDEIRAAASQEIVVPLRYGYTAPSAEEATRSNFAGVVTSGGATLVP